MIRTLHQSKCRERELCFFPLGREPLPQCFESVFHRLLWVGQVFFYISYFSIKESVFSPLAENRYPSVLRVCFHRHSFLLHLIFFNKRKFSLNPIIRLVHYAMCMSNMYYIIEVHNSELKIDPVLFFKYLFLHSSLSLMVKDLILFKQH